jgi:anti-sigma regulatory factor (Ser/Thr protein kinase)
MGGDLPSAASSWDRGPLGRPGECAQASPGGASRNHWPRVGDLAVGLAVTEAVTNVVLHAYPGSVGSVAVTADASPQELVVVVADEGVRARSFTLRAGSGLGVGLALIRELCSSVRIDPASTGTTVTMHFLQGRRSAGKRCRQLLAGQARPTPLRRRYQPCSLRCFSRRRANGERYVPSADSSGFAQVTRFGGPYRRPSRNRSPRDALK